MAWHQNGRARISARSPTAKGICDRCQFMFTLSDLKWQYQYAGVTLQNIRLLVCDHCYDSPQEQLRSIVLPPDPVPVFNPRPERYTTIVPSFVATESPTFAGDDITTEDGKTLIMEIQVVPSPNPEQPAIYPLVPGPYS